MKHTLLYVITEHGKFLVWRKGNDRNVSAVEVSPEFKRRINSSPKRLVKDEASYYGFGYVNLCEGLDGLIRHYYQSCRWAHYVDTHTDEQVEKILKKGLTKRG